MLSKSLELGSCGVQWEPPDGAIGEHTETQLAVRDDAGLTWRVALSPVEFAIAPGEEAALAEDLELSARAMFELRWASKPRAPGAQPRTATHPDWSPVVEAKLGTIGTGRIVRCVRHLAYEQGDEVIVGHLLVPVAKGTVEIRISARLDRQVAEHPLTRVRAALDRTVASLDITALPERKPGSEIALPDAGAAITPPVRFVPSPPVVPNPGSGRGEIVRLGVDGWRRTVHVWRVGRHTFKAKDLHAALVEHADKDATGLAQTGATSIASRSAPIDDYGVCLQVQQYVTFERDGLVRHAVQRWWIAGDGTLWRIGSEAPANMDRQAMLEELAAVQDSFRRI